WNDDPPLPRNLLGQRHLRRACRFGTKFTRGPAPAVGLLAGMLVQERPENRSRLRGVGWRPDALLPGGAIGQAIHRRRWWTNSRAPADDSGEQRWSDGAGTLSELAD